MVIYNNPRFPAAVAALSLSLSSLCAVSAVTTTKPRVPTVMPTPKAPATTTVVEEIEPPPFFADDVEAADALVSLLSSARSSRELEHLRRELDSSWTKAPTLQPTVYVPPTEVPTKNPTRVPTKRPTKLPTNPQPIPAQTVDTCGSIITSDGYDLVLGPYTRYNSLRTSSDFDCNNEDGRWYSKRLYEPDLMYTFEVTRQCEYKFQHPGFEGDWAVLSDVNAWFDQAARTVRRQNNVGYRASDDDVIFNGVVVPNFSFDVDYTGYVVPGHPPIPAGLCPEDFCLRIFGGGVGRRSDATFNGFATNANLPDPELLYAFSNEDAMMDFREFVRHTMRHNFKEKIFLTNHFQRCGCQSFCYEQYDHWHSVICRATCYTEYMCGVQRVYKIQYENDYPEAEKASWHQTGTTEVMEWFNECAKAMFSCDAVPDYDDMSLYKGTNWLSYYHAWPLVTKPSVISIDSLPRLSYMGDDVDGDLVTPLGLCEGDCDTDDDCDTGLVCFQRDTFELVPGCSGSADRNVDFCTHPIPNDPNAPPLVDIPEGHVFGTLGHCEGNCRHTNDCMGSLKCKTRPDLRSIRGCSGLGTYGHNYCYYQGDAIPTMAPTAPVPMIDYLNNYALHGDRYYGFPHNRYANGGPDLAWSCQSEDHRSELERFGDFIEVAQFARDSGTGDTIPSVPCAEDTFYDPVYPDTEDYEGPTCAELTGNDYCYEMMGATCFSQREEDSCTGQKYYLSTSKNTFSYDDVSIWTDDCLQYGNGCFRIDSYRNTKDGTLTKRGAPNTQIEWTKHDGWRFVLKNVKRNGHPTIQGNKKKITYECNTYEGAYRSGNFTEGAGNLLGAYDEIDNVWGDMYSAFCTDAPSMVPSETPTMSHDPTMQPSQQPSFCAESYLTSEDLNIALVMDVSYSTYEKTFSSTNPVGDLNNDGKANTILDATVAAIEELLVAISGSEFLRNDNCEINLISFSTEATNEGIWVPLNPAETGPNDDLVTHLNSIRAPLDSDEVYHTNNGYTNFDAALDQAVYYFENNATAGRKNLIVFMSDGEPNVRGDGDDEGFCSETVTFWNGDDTILNCSDIGVAPGQAHTFCRGGDANCTENEPYQDCVRGPNHCMNADAVTRYDSEIQALNASNVERLSIGIGGDSNVAWGSGLWKIDNNPAKWLGVLPLQALDLDELTEYLSSLCILNTEPPTGAPSVSPSAAPTRTYLPSADPSISPTNFPSLLPTNSPSMDPSSGPTPSPTDAPSEQPSDHPSQNPTEYLSTCHHEGGGRFEYGEVNFCLRTSLGYTSPISGTFNEVNFIESLVRISYDLSTGFCVLAFAVAPKERELATVEESIGGLEAYLCDPETLVGDTTPGGRSRQLPAPVIDYNVPGNSKIFNQGALITVCVFPDGDSYDEGLVMSGIEEFTWIRDPNPLYPDVPDPIVQPAVTDYDPSPNFLTAYVPEDCYGQDWCTFSSVLFAEFYANSGNATGVGSAALRWDMFANVLPERRQRQRRRRRRRLGAAADDAFDHLDPEERVLQFEPEPPAPKSFDMRVELIGDDVVGSGGMPTTMSSGLWLASALLTGAAVALGAFA